LIVKDEENFRQRRKESPAAKVHFMAFL